MFKVITMLCLIISVSFGQQMPRLLFSASEIPSIRERIISGPQEVRDAWDELIANCNYYLTEIPVWDNGFSSPYMVIPKLAFAHIIIDGDPSGYGERAILFFEHIIAIPSANEFAVSQKAQVMAYIIDYCQDLLQNNPTLKSLIESKLLEHIITLRSWVDGWGPHGNNPTVMHAGSLGIAALSLDGIIVDGQLYSADEDVDIAKERITKIYNDIVDENGAYYDGCNFKNLSSVLLVLKT